MRSTPCRHSGILLLNRLAEAFGPAAGTREPSPLVLPQPVDLAGAGPEELRKLGFSHQKARYLIEAARAIVEQRLDMESLAALSDDEAAAWLRQMRGVGRWTAEYVLLRGLGRLHLFPGDDVGARNNLQRWLGLTGKLDNDAVRETLTQFYPYGGLLYFYLLLSRLSQAEYIND